MATQTVNIENKNKGGLSNLHIGLIVLGLFVVLGGGGFWWTNRKPAPAVTVTVEAAKTIAAVEKQAATDIAAVKTVATKKIADAEKGEAQTPAELRNARLKEAQKLQKIAAEKVAAKILADVAAQKLIDEADGMPCPGDGGVFNYSSNVCVPTSCNTGYTKYNNKCYKDSWYPHSYVNSWSQFDNGLTPFQTDNDTDNRLNCMTGCHDKPGCGAYAHDNNKSCNFYKMKPNTVPSTIMVNTSNWDQPRGNYGFGFI